MQLCSYYLPRDHHSGFVGPHVLGHMMYECIIYRICFKFILFPFQGLVVPVLRDVQAMNFADIEKGMNMLGEKVCPILFSWRTQEASDTVGFIPLSNGHTT